MDILHFQAQNQEENGSSSTTNNNRSSTRRSSSTSIADDDDDDSTDDSIDIVRITLNRPKEANAMGKEFMFGFRNILTYLEGQQQQEEQQLKEHQQKPKTELLQQLPRCVVITSSSSKVFCAGADLKERSQMKDLTEVDEYVTMLRTTFQRLAVLQVPVIASISGVAVGGGFELALAADIRLCSSKATFGSPETKLAIIPGAGGTQRLPRLVGPSRAKELIWTGRRIGADEAYRIGLVEEVVGSGDGSDGDVSTSSSSSPSSSSSSTVDDRAIELAFDIARNSGPVAVRAAKEAVDDGMKEVDMDVALNVVERRCYAQTLPTKDRLEGLAAFKEGRRPIYKGH